MSERLDWHGNEAHWRGRLVLAVVRERAGWYLYRYATGRDGVARFKSKESVRNRRDGVAYANGLARLWPQENAKDDA
jgi:hypothetical protein